MNQSFDRYLEFLSNSINRNIKLPAVPVWGTVAEYSAMSATLTSRDREADASRYEPVARSAGLETRDSIVV